MKEIKDLREKPKDNSLQIEKNIRERKKDTGKMRNVEDLNKKWKENS